MGRVILVARRVLERGGLVLSPLRKDVSFQHIRERIVEHGPVGEHLLRVVERELKLLISRAFGGVQWRLAVFSGV